MKSNISGAMELAFKKAVEDKQATKKQTIKDVMFKPVKPIKKAKGKSVSHES